MKRIGILLSLIPVLTAESSAQTPEIEMIELPTLEGYENCYGIAINNQGQILGYCWRWEPDTSTRAFLWESGVITDLGTLGGRDTYPYAFNDRGQIVGLSTTASEDQEAFLWEREGGMRSIARGEHAFSDIQRAYALDINETGQVAGIRYITEADGSGRLQEYVKPFLWDENVGLVDIGDPTMGSTYPIAINDREQVLIHPWGGEGIAWLWDDGVATRLPSLRGDLSYAYGFDLNDAGQVVGASESGHGLRATLWTDAVPFEIPMPSGTLSSVGRGLNGKGDVIGV